MKTERIDCSETLHLPRLVSDYCQGTGHSRGITPGPFSHGAIIRAASQKKFEAGRRNLLSAELERQYRAAGIDIDSSLSGLLGNLRKNNCFTISTGHQLNIFSGPLYVIIKILQTIKLADELNAGASGHRFIPVLWLASEDHDREEINHIHINSRTITWNTKQEGRSGAFSLEGFEEVLQKVIEVLPEGGNGDFLRKLFTDSYQEDRNLSDCTRRLYHGLFGSRGLLIVDGDSKELKKQFAGHMKQEISRAVLLHEVGEFTANLPPEYKVQASPREVNLFYLEDGSRELITLNGKDYATRSGSVKWNREELPAEIDQSPWKFSPNVLLRPLYQETVLPDLCYTGGPAEIAYWLELPGAFQALEIEFPVLNLRNSVMWLPKEVSEKLSKLGLKGADLFGGKQAVEGRLPGMEEGIAMIDRHIESVELVMEKLASEIASWDSTMKASVLAGRKRIEIILESLKSRLKRSVRRKHDEKLSRYGAIREKVFPGGIPQERYDNFVPYFLRHGTAFFDRLSENLRNGSTDYTVIGED